MSFFWLRIIVSLSAVEALLTLADCEYYLQWCRISGLVPDKWRRRGNLINRRSSCFLWYADDDDDDGSESKKELRWEATRDFVMKGVEEVYIEHEGLLKIKRKVSRM